MLFTDLSENHIEQHGKQHPSSQVAPFNLEYYQLTISISSSDVKCLLDNPTLTFLAFSSNYKVKTNEKYKFLQGFGNYFSIIVISLICKYITMVLYGLFYTNTLIENKLF